MNKQRIKSIVKRIVALGKEEKKIPIPHQINTTEMLAGKIALVIGGSGGIGKAISVSFMKNGAKVIIAGTSEDKLKRTKEEIMRCLEDETANKRLAGIVIDLHDVSAFDEKLGEALSLFDEHRIDILVNSAGVLTHSNFWEITEDEYDMIMDINVKGTFFMCQTIGEYMRNNNIKGKILNVSSSSALRPAWTPYQISKWAIRGFTKGLADTLLPYGITVNAIAPGQVATAMLGKNEGEDINNVNVPIGRYAEPEEIANLATFMVSDMGEMIVGDTFYITGGSGTISMHK